MTLENGEYMYRVLVVEPDKFYKESILKLLSELDYDLAVESVSSGDAAIEFAANNCIDILISEILVEDMDGFTLVDEIKEINKNLKFIIVSGNNEFSNVKKAIKLGAIDYIHKPFEKSELVDAVDIAISKCDESKTIIEQSDINNEFIKDFIAEDLPVPLRPINTITFPLQFNYLTSFSCNRSLVFFAEFSIQYFIYPDFTL